MRSNYRRPLIASLREGKKKLNQKEKTPDRQAVESMTKPAEKSAGFRVSLIFCSS
jgi:hypothetical protein